MVRVLSKKRRLQIFKRDKFTCCHCHRSPLDVTLTVERKLPIDQGGKNHADNLFTSCHDCRRSRATTSIAYSLGDLLADVVVRLEILATDPVFVAVLAERRKHPEYYERLDREREKKKYIERIEQAQEERDSLREDSGCDDYHPGLEELRDVWFSCMCKYDFDDLDGNELKSMNQFLWQLPFHEIESAIRIAEEKVASGVIAADEDITFRYFCGICWKRIKANERSGVSP